MNKVVLRSFALFFTILFVWGVYRYFFHFEEWTDELISKPIIYLLPVWYLVKVVEKQSLLSLGLSKKNLGKNILIGIGIGILLATEYLLTRRFKYGSVHYNPENLSLIFLISNYAISLTTGFVEEVVFRGYIQSRLSIGFKNAYTGIIMGSLLFTIVHMPLMVFVLKYSMGEVFVGGLLVFVLGVINGILFQKTKTLTASVITHSIWNFSNILFR